MTLVSPERWHRYAVRDGCQIHDNPNECELPIQGCHIVSRHRLRRHGLDAHLWDTRNAIGACYRAHRRSDMALERFPVDRLPAGVWEFAAEHGLTYDLERVYGQAA